jgi:hypothetical protein
MAGRLPKHPKLKAGRSKSVTRAVIVTDNEFPEKPARLPACPNDGGWHSMARRFWSDVWESPMIGEFLPADIHGLFRLLVLVDQFWKKPTTSLSAEIRLMGQLFGLSPIDRRRLEWQVVSTEEKIDRHHERRVKRARVVEGDPRDLLGK